MTTSIKSVTTTEAKNRIHELFGDLGAENVAIVRLEDMDETPVLNSSVRLANILEVRKAIELKLNREIDTADVSVVRFNEPATFKISTATPTVFAEKLKELGFSFNSSDIAVVKAEDLGVVNTNISTTGRKFKK